MTHQETATLLRAKLCDLAGRPPLQIVDSTEIYRDLKISGMDLYDLTCWISETFGVDFGALKLGDYGPPEGAEWLAWGRRYKSLTVGALLVAIEVGELRQ